MSARPKSAASNSSVKKAPPVTSAATSATTTATPSSGRSGSKLSRNVTKSDTETPVKLLPSSRISGDHKASPRSVNSKPSVDLARPASGYSKPGSDGGPRRVVDGADSPAKSLADRRASRLSLPPEQKRAPKALDWQAQLAGLQEDLKKATDRLAVAEKEKAQVADELKEARRSGGETNEKLSEAVAGRKRAEETCEIEKFRALEMEQAGIDAADKNSKEMEDLRTQQASHVEALLSASQELLKVKKELAEVTDAKNQAIKESGEKADLLTAEIASLKALLESKIESAANEGDVVLGMKSEIETLKLELERSRASGEKLEVSLERLNGELGESKMAQAYSNNLVKEWKQQVEEADAKQRCLKKQVEEMERLLQESKQREESLVENVAQAEAAVEELQVELEASKEAAGEAQGLVEEWRQKAKELEKLAEEATLTEKTALDSLSAVKMQLEESQGLLREAGKKVARLAEKVEENGAAAEQLSVQLEAAKMAEAYADSLVMEWKQRVEEANSSEKAGKELLSSVKKEAEMSGGTLKKAEAQIDVLEEKVGLLEMSLERQRGDHRQAENRAATAEADAFEMAKMIEGLKIQLETVQEEKLQALENEKLAASNVQSLLEEKNKVINMLENSRYEEEKSKKAMESLAAALHEVSAEAREAKESFLARQAEHESYENQIDDLKCILKETNEKYKTMLDDARHEVDSLMMTNQKSKEEFEESRAEWEEGLNSSKRAEEEVMRLRKLVKELEEEVSERARLMESLKVAESEASYMQGVLGEAKAESMKLKESVLENESELREVRLENEELRIREAAAQERMEELSKLLEEAVAKNSEDNDRHVDNGNSNGLLPNLIRSPEAKEHENGREEKLGQLTENEEEDLTGLRLFQNMNGGLKNDEKQGEPGESFDEDVVDMGAISEPNGSVEYIENNNTSPSRQQKKKKAMLGRFGSLLKKNSSKSQKS